MADCSSLNHCSNKGDCILPNTCDCYPGYDGAACNTTAKPNLHAPVFAAPLYNASVLENSPIGTKIIRVQANDSDTERNAQVFFSLDDANAISTIFTIDSISGEIFMSSVLDYETSPRLFKLKVVASDNGTPRKSTFVFMYINVVDVNDNCPVLNSLQTNRFNISQHTQAGTLLTVISATDKDSGLNGEVRYSLLSSSNPDRSFGMGEQNGELTVVGELQAKQHRVVIVARDLGVSSCSRQTDILVNVFADVGVNATKPTSEISSTAIDTEGTRTTGTTGTTGTTAFFVVSFQFYLNFRNYDT